MILKVERTWKHTKTAERNSTICVNAFFTNLLPKNVNVNVVIMIYCQGNSKFLGQKKNYSIHYLTSQNQGLSGLKNIWPVIMSGDLLSVLFSALCQWWAEANNWSARHWQITIFCNNRSEVKRSDIFAQQQSHKGEKLGFIYSWAEYYLQPNKDGRHCTWADHYLKAVICRSHGGLSAN